MDLGNNSPLYCHFSRYHQIQPAGAFQQLGVAAQLLVAAVLQRAVPSHHLHDPVPESHQVHSEGSFLASGREADVQN